MPTFLVRYADAHLAEANIVFAVAILVGAGGGNLFFAKIAQDFQTRYQNVNFLVPAVFTVPGAVLGFMLVNFTKPKIFSYPAAVVAIFFVFSWQAPTLGLLMNATKPDLRASAASIWSILQRFFDLLSPILAGTISDHAGLRAAMEMMWIFLLVADVCWWMGYMLPGLSLSGSPSEPRVLSYWSLLSDEHGTGGNGSIASNEKAQLVGAGQKAEYDSVRLPH